jgi:putative acyltransferase
VFLLGGQGSQYFGMARSLYEKDERFRALQEELDEIATLACGRSPLSYLHRSRIGGPCDDLELTSLGLFMVEYGLAVRLRDHGLEPDIIVGASLGEFISLAVSGMADPHMALGFIARFTRAIPSVLPAGGMTAVLGSLEAVTAAVKSDEVSLASVNSAQHVVLSGKSSALADVSRRLAISGAICCELPVRYPFHSSACDSLGALMRRLVDGYSPGFSAADRVSVTGPETWSSSIAGPSGVAFK